MIATDEVTVMERTGVPGEVLIVEGRAEIRVDLRSYRLVAIKAAAYRVADRCTIAIGSAEGDFVTLSFLFRQPPAESTVRAAVISFYQEALDQELREQLREETEPVRALILAQAFSKTDLIKRS